MKFTRLFLAIIVLISALSCDNDMKTEKDVATVVHNKFQIDTVRNYINKKQEPYYNAYYQLLSRADLALENKVKPQTSLYIPPTYEDGKGHNKASEFLMKNAYDSYVLALTWKLNNQKKYAEKAIKILNSWAENNRFLSKNFDTPLVMAYGGIGFIYAASLLADYDGWNQDRFKIWVKNTYLPNILIARKRTNNQGSWGNLAALASYGYLEKNKEFNKEIRRTKYLINVQINSSGFLSQEIKRGKDGMVYTYFSLAPLTQSMYIIYNKTGDNLFLNSTEGKKIKKALDTFYIYVERPNEWPFYKGSNLNKPVLTATHNWPANLYEAMSVIYNDDNYKMLVTPYRPILGGYIRDRNLPSHLAWNFPTLIPPIINE